MAHVTPSQAIEQLTPTIAEVNLGALRANARWIRQQAAPAHLLAVVKANAYGHGAIPVARTLEEEGVSYFGVATVPEAIELREAGITGRILVMEAPLPEYLPAYERYGLDVNVPSLEIARWITEHSTKELHVHVKLDTGLGRLGMPPKEAVEAIAALRQYVPPEHIALWTHLATADEPGSPFVREQVKRFRSVYEHVKDAVGLVHVAPSGGLLDFPDVLHLAPGRTLVRAGLLLYGYAPAIGYSVQPDVVPVMRVETRIIQIKTVEARTTVSYGRTWVAPDEAVIAVLAAGYADGYPRHASNRAYVRIRSKRYPVVGMVCMDMTMVHLGHPRDVDPDIRVGDKALLFGPEGPDAAELAQWSDTISYEILCRVSPRVRRVYRDA